MAVGGAARVSRRAAFPRPHQLAGAGAQGNALPSAAAEQVGGQLCPGGRLYDGRSKNKRQCGPGLARRLLSSLKVPEALRGRRKCIAGWDGSSRDCLPAGPVLASRSRCGVCS